MFEYACTCTAVLHSLIKAESALQNWSAAEYHCHTHTTQTLN